MFWAHWLPADRATTEVYTTTMIAAVRTRKFCSSITCAVKAI